MPVWLRRFHIQRINNHIKKQNEEYEKITKGTTSVSNDIKGPGVSPSSTYNFSK